MRQPNDARVRPIADTVRSSALLGMLTTEELEAFVQIGHGAIAPPGRSVLHPANDAVAVVLGGVVGRYVTSPTGDEFLLDLLGPGEVVGLPTATGHVEHQIDARAMSPVESLVVPGNALRRLVNATDGVARACLRAAIDELAAARRDVIALGNTSTTERVELRILQLAERWGTSELGGIRITVPLTQEQLASWARSSRESTAKVLHGLREAGIVHTGRRELIVLDIATLRRRCHAGSHDDTRRALLRAIG